MDKWIRQPAYFSSDSFPLLSLNTFRFFLFCMVRCGVDEIPDHRESVSVEQPLKTNFASFCTLV